MSSSVRSLWAKSSAGAVVVLAAALLGSAPAQAAPADPSLVHATEANACRLNVRAEPSLKAAPLTTLTCGNYTTCTEAAATPDQPCGRTVAGDSYTCVDTKGKSVTSDRWSEVAWRAPQRSYVATACAGFRA